MRVKQLSGGDYFSKEVAQAHFFEKALEGGIETFELNVADGLCIQARNLGFANDDSKFANFWIIFDPLGTPWVEGNNYLIDKVLESGFAIDSATIKKIASDLSHFMTVLSKAGLSFNESPYDRLKRPVYYYNAHLNSVIRRDRKGHRVSARRIGSVTGFYKWYKSQHSFACQYPLWTEIQVEGENYDKYGFETQYSKTRKDVGIRLPKTKGVNKQIVDERVLTPLEMSEQIIVVDALIELGRAEMIYVFLIALTTGARIQTALTIRVANIRSDGLGGEYKAIDIGLGTDVDAKGDSQNVLFLPEWVRYSLEQYVSSPRYLQRKELASNRGSESQYVFLTKFGNPFYISREDRKKTPRTSPPDGAAIRQFISNELLPYIESKGHKIAFGFHDLRATFAANLVEEMLLRVEDGETTLSDAIRYVQERLGHSDVKTTMRYFERAKKLKIMDRAQTDFEKYLRSKLTFKEGDYSE